MDCGVVFLHIPVEMCLLRDLKKEICRDGLSDMIEFHEVRDQQLVRSIFQ